MSNSNEPSNELVASVDDMGRVVRRHLGLLLALCELRLLHDPIGRTDSIIEFVLEDELVSPIRDSWERLVRSAPNEDILRSLFATRVGEDELFAITHALYGSKRQGPHHARRPGSSGTGCRRRPSR
jgi:hypothetical protein